MTSMATKILYSEEEMALAFQKKLLSKKGLPGIGPFWRVFKEVLSLSGRPDFLGIQKKNRKKVQFSNLNGSIVVSSIMALLKPNTSKSLKTIVKNTGFSLPVVKRVLKGLVEDNHIVQAGPDMFKGTEVSLIAEMETFVFELKLNNTKRAIFQAQQYKSFAHHVFIIAPPSRIPNYRKFKKVLDLWGIGLASFDPDTLSFKIENPSVPKEPASKQQLLYTVYNAMAQQAAL